MIHDLIRTACVIAVLSVASSLFIETRLRLAAVDLAARQAQQTLAYAPIAVPVAPQSPGRLRALGRATLNLADAALGVVR